MASPRVQKIFEGLPDQLKRLGGYSYTGSLSAQLRWQGRVDATVNATDGGKDACVLDIDSASWSTGNRRAVILAQPADTNPSVQALHTQSHASGNLLDGSVRFQVWLETPASWTAAHAKFERLLQHMLMGQLGAPVELLYTANGTQPTLAGVNGASSTNAATSSGAMLPYGGVSYPGGV